MAKKEKTREEMLKELWSRHTHMDLHLPPFPVTRKPFVPGEGVKIGGLKEACVVEMSEDNRFILVEHLKGDRDAMPGETMMNVFPWTSVFRPSETSPDIRFAKPLRVRPNFFNIDIEGLLGRSIGRGIIDTQDYQRDYVWTEEDKDRLIDSVFHERPIGAFMFVEFPYSVHQGKLEILDGKQRLNTLLEFYTSKRQHEGYYFHELSPGDRSFFLNQSAMAAHLDGERVTRAELLETFLELNTGGVPQAEEHLEHVRALYRAEMKKVKP